MNNQPNRNNFMICPNCRQYVTRNSVFCNFCGFRFYPINQVPRSKPKNKPNIALLIMIFCGMLLFILYVVSTFIDDTESETTENTTENVTTATTELTESTTSESDEYIESKVDDEIVFYAFAQEVVEGLLKDPDSAKFPSLASGDVAVDRYDSLVVVQGYVTANNSFGAKTREYYYLQLVVQYNNNGWSYLPAYIKMGDQESGEYINPDEM